MVVALKHGGVAVPRGQRTAAMPAHIVESSQLLVLTSHHYDGVASNLGQKEITRIVNLSQISNALPRPGEHALLFKLVKRRVCVPTRRNCLSSLQRFDPQMGFHQV